MLRVLARAGGSVRIGVFISESPPPHPVPHRRVVLSQPGVSVAVQLEDSIRVPRLPKKAGGVILPGGTTGNFLVACGPIGALFNPENIEDCASVRPLIESLGRNVVAYPYSLLRESLDVKAHSRSYNTLSVNVGDA